MAKGNMFQGFARGKVGDVVFSRVNGEQISRVRNRYPKNPRTNAQLYQRAIMATVMAAYSNGKEIFDHSFQGYAKGAENQRRFLAENAKLLRSQLAADINSTNVATDEGNAHLTYPGGSTIVPNAYKISEGNYQQAFFVPDGARLKFAARSSSSQTVASYATLHGLIPGDIYTIVIVTTDTSLTPLFSVSGGDGLVSQVLPGTFAFARLTVKNDVLSDSDVVVSIPQIFNIETSPEFTSASPLAETPISDVGGSFVLFNGSIYGAFGVIRSRLDKDLRSTSYLTLYGPDSYGLNWYNVLPGWKQGTASVGDSDLILEGGNF